MSCNYGWNLRHVHRVGMCIEIDGSEEMIAPISGSGGSMTAEEHTINMVA